MTDSDAQLIREPQTPKWEYNVEEFDEPSGEIELASYLNGMGSSGWELIHVSVSLRTFIFKRRKK